MDAAFFDQWSLDYDEDVIACDEADIYPFAGYRRTIESILNVIKDILMQKFWIWVLAQRV